jgi:hypothetical protein
MNVQHVDLTAPVVQSESEFEREWALAEFGWLADRLKNAAREVESALSRVSDAFDFKGPMDRAAHEYQHRIKFLNDFVKRELDDFQAIAKALSPPSA